MQNIVEGEMMFENNKMLAKIKQIYKEYREDTEIPFRVVEIIEKKNVKYVVIGLRYSRMSFNQSLETAVMDDKLMAGLSVPDARRLSMYKPRL